MTFLFSRRGRRFFADLFLESLVGIFAQKVRKRKSLRTLKSEIHFTFVVYALRTPQIHFTFFFTHYAPPLDIHTFFFTHDQTFSA